MEDKVSLQDGFQEQDNNIVSFHLPAIVTESNPHREPFIQITPMPDNTLLAVGQDGLVTAWTPDLKLKKSRCILDENKQPNRKIKWISDSTFMPQYNKLIVGTCDREIRLYEVSNFEPYCQFVGFESMPLHLGYSLRDADECIIYFGDEQGCVNMIIMSHMAETLRNWTKCEVVDEIPSIAIDNITERNHVKYIRWKVHNDWVTQIRYVHSIESTISSSNDDYTALIIGCVEGTKNVQKRLKDLMESDSVKSKRSLLAGNVPLKRNINDESLFRVKRGVKTFDFSKEANILVTGGLDRIVRVWNPYVPSWPTGLLRGHSSPITYLQIGDENTKIYSVSTDCTVMVWDIENHTCLMNVISKASQIRGDIAACYFAHNLRALYIATECLSALQLRETAILLGPPSASHSESVTCCLYNQLYQQMISCSEGSVMKTWDLLTGQLVAEVGAAHGQSAVTCIALDAAGNRLTSGGKDGSLKLWEYTSISLTPVTTLRQGSTAGSSGEISDITYTEHNKNQYIVSISYDGQIRIFPEAVISEHVMPQFTWNNDMKNEHGENKFGLASSSSNIAAISSCTGEVFVWNLEAGDPLCHFSPFNREELDAEIGNLVIHKAVFLSTRCDRKKDSAVLITSGSKGYITFWNIVGGGKMFARFEGSQYKCMVNAIAVSEDDSILCAADQLFYIYVWNISQYALGAPEGQPPVLLHCWRAHMSDITRVIPVKKHKVIVTTAQDCTVKLWTIQGEYIGTFGQSKPWCLNKIEPKKEEPGDNNQPSQASECVQAAEEEQKQMDNICEVEASSITIDDKYIADELKERIAVKSKNRTKMASPKQVDLQQACGRLNAYKSLQICDLMSVSAVIQKPNPAAELNDPYDLAF
ncbi:WD repeat-containing protein 49-like isoform X2 [Hyla sarda]|uniref:WD repeat-containing protein 49-like isoform X2 n=1 Tax=Hyla sarda TaxID=327740 RepID=UPI0024C3F452|nr:WD repeat-containing protein 49-like isoform X2 [Hyla sarda]